MDVSSSIPASSRLKNEASANDTSVAIIDKSTRFEPSWGSAPDLCNRCEVEISRRKTLQLEEEKRRSDALEVKRAAEKEFAIQSQLTLFQMSQASKNGLGKKSILPSAGATRGPGLGIGVGSNNVVAPTINYLAIQRKITIRESQDVSGEEELMLESHEAISSASTCHICRSFCESEFIHCSLPTCSRLFHIRCLPTTQDFVVPTTWETCRDFVCQACLESSSAVQSPTHLGQGQPAWDVLPFPTLEAWSKRRRFLEVTLFELLSFLLCYVMLCCVIVWGEIFVRSCVHGLRKEQCCSRKEMSPCKSR